MGRAKENFNKKVVQAYCVQLQQLFKVSYFFFFFFFCCFFFCFFFFRIFYGNCEMEAQLLMQEA